MVPQEKVIISTCQDFSDESPYVWQLYLVGPLFAESITEIPLACFTVVSVPFPPSLGSDATPGSFLQ